MEEMIASVAELIANKDKRLAEGRRCAEYVLRHHSPKSVVAQYERIFEDMTRDQRPLGPRSLARNETTRTAESDR
jgi:hypothetical protein